MVIIPQDTPNNTLLSLEAKATRDFSEVLAHREAQGKTGVPGFETLAMYDAVGIKITVTYHPDRKWAYEFTTEEVRGHYDGRDACLFSLAAHFPEEK